MERNPTSLSTVRQLSDDLLLERVGDLLGRVRRDDALLIAHLGEVDDRRLYARFPVPSMFAYCTRVLHLSEAAAYRRIALARAAREYPVLLEFLADGRLHLSGLMLLIPHLRPDNCTHLLARATHLSKREVESLVAELAPQRDAVSAVRKLPDRSDGIAGASLRVAVPSADAGCTAAGPSAAETAQTFALPSAATAPGAESLALPTVAVTSGDRTPAQLSPHEASLLCVRGAELKRSAQMLPTAPARYKVQFTASADLRDKLVRLQALMRSALPDGDLAAIIEAAVSEKLARIEARRFGVTARPMTRVGGVGRTGGRRVGSRRRAASSARTIPAAVRRAVRERDGGRCRFVDERGERCSARDALEFHHRVPYACGGEHTVENLWLMCRAHNAVAAEADFGWRPSPRRMSEEPRPSPRSMSVPG